MIYYSHTAKVILVILALAVSSLIFGISAAGYYSYPESKVIVRRGQTQNSAISSVYKDKAKSLYGNLAKLAENKQLAKTEAASVKDELLTLNVPKEFLDLHIGLVFASDKLIEYSESKDKKKLKQATEIMEQVKKQYGWLN